MSDKSFGDFTSRNVVKNPLLSTAVTGLSIEDLTHNAVLLPAIPSQELITRQDRNETQMQNPRHSDHATPNPSGDASHPHSTPNPKPNSSKNYNPNDFSNIPPSKPSSKSDDDFDVNEYFARLQGSRYVSAPLNTNILEQSTNLQAEDNLEEINLNEPDKTQAPDEIQQSLTADIAQNFSQLPTVLPQVASAVFSSFSSMLSLKSREQTPDERAQEHVYANVQSVPEVQHQAAPPPLKEPPTAGTTSNYRITTRKKVYAQIPGLSSGDTHLQFNPPPSTAPYFPEATAANSQAVSVHADSKIDNDAVEFVFQYSVLTPHTVVHRQNVNNPLEETETFNMNPVAKESNIAEIPSGFMVPSLESDVLRPKDDESFSVHPSQSVVLTPQNPQPSTAIIPPPPMFSNLSRRDSQPSVGKAVLPPSVARRISANQPIMKPQAPPNVMTHENLFIPKMPPEPNVGPTFGSSVQPSYAQSFDLTSNIGSVTSQHGSSFIPPGEMPEIPTNPLVPSVSTVIPPQHLPPAMIYHPMHPDLVPSLKKEEYKDIPNIQQRQIPQHFGNLPSEPPKPIQEPPKFTGNLSYRMSKKKPQYYSGPIEGVGSISNNIKPIINPVEASSFQGALFTPDQSIAAASNSPYPDYSMSSTQELKPFDISRPANIETYPYVAPQQSDPIQPGYITAFDLSRPTTDRYEKEKEEAKGFGIIGSLKSKLSSIGIDKIQNTVTTFFDPAYNTISGDNKPEKPYNYQDVDAGYKCTNYPQNESTLEVFVPNVNQEQPVPNQYYHQIDNVLPPKQKLEYPRTEDYYGTQHQGEAYPSSYMYPNWYDNLNQQQPQLGECSRIPKNLPQESTKVLAETKPSTSILPYVTQDNVIPFKTAESQNKITPVLLPVTNIPPNLFDNQQPLQVVPDYTNEKLKTQRADHLNIEGPKPLQMSDSTPKSFFDNPSMEFLPERTEQNLPKIKRQSAAQPSLTSIFDKRTSDTSTRESGLKIDSSYAGYESDFIRDVPEMSQVFTDPPSKGFFDKQTSLVLPFAIKNPDDIKQAAKENKSSEYLQQKPIETILENRIKNKHENVKKDSGNEMGVVHSDYIKRHKDTIKDYKVPYDYPLSANRDIVPQETAELNPSAFSLFEPSVETSSISIYDHSSVVGKDAQDVAKLEKTSLFEDNEPRLLDDYLGVINDENERLISELNICETCREVNKLEEKEADNLTSQLIENITAPIQLANPVEYPLAKDESPEEEPLTDLAHITENIIQSLILARPVRSADIIDNPGINYGWSTDGQSAKGLLDHDYSQYPPRRLITEKIPTNACDEIKAEYRNSQDDTSVLAHQMNIPTAPPEEDTKSDESGLDVHSIEQDAKNDFLFFEDFIIEPSETDDDKIEYREREKSSDDPAQDGDTFTNRVERFKKMENTTESNDSAQEMRPEMKSFDVPTPTSPAITIASYFDTGNYAVENHYRNSITSPSTSFTTNTTKPMRIPPGFEEEYRRRLSGISSKDLTSTNMPSTSKKVFTENASSVDSGSICDAKVESMVEKLIDDDDSSLSDGVDQSSMIVEPDEDEVVEESSSTNGIVDEFSSEHQPGPSDVGSNAKEINSDDSDTYSDFSRLSSYFSSPAEPDHPKSFFELSQSQNHYRHKTDDNTYDSIQNNVKDFFETAPNVSTNIPQNLVNTALIRDLTSPKNLNPSKDIVKTVNYFTVEYNFNKANEIKIDEPINININKTIFNSQGNNNEISNRRQCCDMTKIVTNSRYKVKKNMESNSENTKDTNAMDLNKENVVKKSMTVNFCEQTYQDEADDRIVVMSENRTSSDHAPVKHHWFYQVDSEEKSIWRGFSAADSRALENAFNSPDLNENTLVATDGGRYDVNVMQRIKTAVYWDEKPTKVMRCSWFYKGTTDARYVPYSESIAEKLEEEYIHGMTTGEWHRRLVLPNNELVVMHGPAVMVHFLQNSVNDAFTTSPQAMMRPRVVRRGCLESEIEDTEPSSIDHLLLLCHGVGSACDMRFRPVEEVVDDFRATSLQLIQSHYKNSFDSGIVGRVEVLPISWHSTLHSGQTGVDRRLAAVTLESIPRLRNFTNDTILDVLFYTSPVFCQTIIDTVCSELNRIYSLFKSRNPEFKGGVSLGGHSLGSVILYDLLCHQVPKDVPLSKEKQFVTGPAGTGQPCVKYPSLDFIPDALYALGSPIAMFNCIRGVETLGQDFCLPTCKNFFNIFHPYDPIAYRIEPLITPQLRDVKPFLIPHHKGRKRMHLELKDTMARVGADIKQKLIESIKNTWSSMWKTQPPPDQHLEKVVEEEMEKEELNSETKEENGQENDITPEMLGKLNDGRRIDYVLQEAPFEMINEYLFAMRSHVCYWESEDTMLVMLREIYSALGVSPDCSLPQQTMTVQRSRTVHDENDISPSDYPSTSRGSV